LVIRAKATPNIFITDRDRDISEIIIGDNEEKNVSYVIEGTVRTKGLRLYRKIKKRKMTSLRANSIENYNAGAAVQPVFLFIINRPPTHFVGGHPVVAAGPPAWRIAAVSRDFEDRRSEYPWHKSRARFRRKSTRVRVGGLL